MKYLLFFVGACLLASQALAQDIYSCRKVHLSFFSEAPLENIEAKTDQGVSAINIKTKVVYFKVPVTSFRFKKKLMEEHFNDNYLESEKYPFAEFKGNIQDAADFRNDGTYPVTVTGTLNIHGVDKNYTEKGTLVVKGNTLNVNATFNVRVADHRIKIPSLVVKNVAEVVAITVQAAYEIVNK
ncbi:YceI family protein [Chitinophaga nivalis]|uniref:YceI family protein n=1 Tax=Chitinophaga nivalis TaxID=2991709 RepID=A0ABT3ITV9_9BACT|nr:YceI family protein [Chitinophaga nivalis]MCW3462873.1 YceI family protein [Chitinophaga nivalis]MCW3487437.1 YceI family protein [Chitinophaga nivalis]